MSDLDPVIALVERLRQAALDLKRVQDDWAELMDAPTLSTGQQRTIDVLTDAADLLASLGRQVQELQTELSTRGGSVPGSAHGDLPHRNPGNVRTGSGR